MAQVDRRAAGNGSGLGPVTKIITITDGADNITPAELASAIAFVEQSKGTNGTGDSAFSVVGVAGAGTTVVHLALQGSGDLTVGGTFNGVAAHTAALVVDFDNS